MKPKTPAFRQRHGKASATKPSRDGSCILRNSRRDADEANAELRRDNGNSGAKHVRRAQRAVPLRNLRQILFAQEAAEEVGGDACCNDGGADYQFVCVAEELALVAEDRGDHQG